MLGGGAQNNNPGLNGFELSGYSLPSLGQMPANVHMHWRLLRFVSQLIHLTEHLTGFAPQISVSLRVCNFATSFAFSTLTTEGEE